jgi:hypothetical protein
LRDGKLADGIESRVLIEEKEENLNLNFLRQSGPKHAKYHLVVLH